MRIFLFGVLACSLVFSPALIASDKIQKDEISFEQDPIVTVDIDTNAPAKPSASRYLIVAFSLFSLYVLASVKVPAFRHINSRLLQIMLAFKNHDKKSISH